MAIVQIYIQNTAEFSQYRRRSKSGRIGIVNGRKAPFTPLGKALKWRREGQVKTRKMIAVGQANGRAAGVEGGLINRIFDPRERSRQDAATAKTLRDWKTM